MRLPLGHGHSSRQPASRHPDQSRRDWSPKQILFGPAEVDDGSQNLVGAITTCMGNVGANTIAEFQQTEIIIAPSIKTEGKLFQTVQSVGMGTSVMKERRVVITGLGAITPVGNDVDTFWRNLQNGVSGIERLQVFDTERV